jgi:hypothetical protein
MGKYALLQPGQHPPRAAEFPVLSILDLSDAQLGQLCEPEGGVLVLDLETQGTRVWDCTRLVVMFSVADASGAMAVHIGTNRAGQERWRKLLGMWAHKRTPLLAHNVAFDACWLSRDLTLALAPVAPGVPVDAEFWDTGIHWHNWFGCTLAMAKHFASESFIGQSHGLKHLQKDLLGWPESNEKELDEWLCNNGWGEWVNKKLPDGSKVPSPKPNKAEMWRAPADVLGRYAALDSESTWLLWDKVLRPVWDTFGAYREMHQDWMHGPDGNQRHLAWQKLRGVAIDTDRAETLRTALEARLAELEDEFRAHPDVAAHIQAMEAEVVQEIANREPSRWKKLPGDGGGVPPQYTKSGAVSKAWLSWQEKQARARQLREDITASEARDDGQPVGTAAEFQSSHWTGWRVKHEKAKAARHFNLRSAEQKRQLFYDRMGLEVLVWTEPDNPNSEPQPGTDEEAMKGWGEAGKLLMTYATVEKLRSTIESLQEKLDSAGRYHPELRVPGTQTGRLSGSGGFNWQNVAKRKEYLEIFRAPLGKVLMFADIAALEPATLAQRSQDPTYLMVYGPEAKPTDIYLQVAANLGGELGGKIRATGFDPSNPTAEAVAKAKKEAKKERNIAKLLHLSANYGAGAGKIRLGLAEQGIEVSLAEAKRLHTAYWKLFAQVKNYEKWLRAQWENNGGWWLNPIGRPVCADERKLKDLCNVDCQSGGHDIFLLFTKVLAEELTARGVVYQPWNYDIHDCTALEIDKEDVEVVREVVDKVVPDKVNAILGGVVRLKWEANFVECWAEDKTESPSIDELGVKL